MKMQQAAAELVRYNCKDRGGTKANLLRRQHHIRAAILRMFALRNLLRPLLEASYSTSWNPLNPLQGDVWLVACSPCAEASLPIYH